MTQPERDWEFYKKHIEEFIKDFPDARIKHPFLNLYEVPLPTPTPATLEAVKKIKKLKEAE